MAIVVSSSEADKNVTISINGRFDFSLHNEFRKAYKNNCNNGWRVIINLKDTDYLDSSALGMLLLLKEHAENNFAEVKITNINHEIREILNIASFDKLFALDG